MSFDEDERNRRQLREIEDLRQSMRSRYIPIKWMEKRGMQIVTGRDRKFDSTYMAFLYTLIDQWREENEDK